jgi:hypothetical protein
MRRRSPKIETSSQRPLPRGFGVAYSQVVMKKRTRTRNSQNGSSPKSPKESRKRAGSLADKSKNVPGPIALDETAEQREKRLARRMALTFEPFDGLPRSSLALPKIKIRDAVLHLRHISNHFPRRRTALSDKANDFLMSSVVLLELIASASDDSRRKLYERLFRDMQRTNRSSSQTKTTGCLQAKSSTGSRKADG